MRIQPVFPYFLRMKLNQQDGAMREALREGFKRNYLGLAGDYQQLMKSKQAQERQYKIEFSDRYSQATIYHNLGLLAQALENYAEARVNLQTALEIYLEYQDDYWANVAREALAQLPD
ncbi:tetratricopeptide repeat protein [Coleofasciculus sp. G2-EDA-02]|uniref:tetratricopeptide repeat protein n=1 Tax=Coleofasciculus sp. G2-EDA-02 TaxID=3069529 RepID=UPI0032F23F77